MTDFTQKDPEARECVFNPHPTAGSPEHTVGGEHESAQEGVTDKSDASKETVVLEKTLQSPVDCKEIKPVNSNGNQSSLFIGRTDAEAPILWPPDVKSQLTGKDPDGGKD